MASPYFSAAWAFHRDTSNASPVNSPSRKFRRPVHSDDTVITLPPPWSIEASLGALITSRRSCRRFSSTSLPLEVVSTALQVAYGAQDRLVVDGYEFQTRPVPSAGARYPLDVHLLVQSVQGVAAGVYRYFASDHVLRRTGPPVASRKIAELFLDQPYLSRASTVVVLTGRLQETMERYGDRGYRYVLFEAGHVAQNIALAATALNLGSLNLGGFYDQALADVLVLEPTQEVPLYGLALGIPASEDPSDLGKVAH